MKPKFACLKYFGLFVLLLLISSGGVSPLQPMSVQAENSPLDTQQAIAMQTSANQILREWWVELEGETVSELTSSENFPQSPSDFDFLSTFETPSNWEDNYGTRMRGFLIPPVDGNYVFWIAADQQGELWLSSNQNPADAIRIANVPSPTLSREWDKFPEQESISISLQGGESYYIEALMKESTDSDHLAVAWQIPGGDIEVIEGAYLSPFTRPLNNVALNGFATQSSTRSSSTIYVASNAIDGNIDGNSLSNSITHTNNDFQAWWEVDLGASYYIDTLRLWNRTDCCGNRLSDFYVLISEEPFESQSLDDTLAQSGVRAFFFDGPASRNENFLTRTMGQFVRVQLTGQNFLQLAEVEVFGTAVATETCGSLRQEAENGFYFGAFEAGFDALASNSFYTHVPEDNPVEFYSQPDVNYMSYCVNIDLPGLFQINSQIYAADGGSNSFYVTLDDLPADGITWSFEPITAVYAEDYVSSLTNDPSQFILEAKQLSLKFYQREDGGRLDWFEFELVNARPIVINPGNQTHTIGDTISLPIEVSDAEEDTLKFDAFDLPEGLSIDAQTGLIEGTLTTVGEYSVVITVDDDFSGPALISFVWTVEDTPNNSPTITPLPDQTNIVGEAVDIQIEASDADGDPLTFLATGLPAGLEIDEVSGVISGVLTTIQTRSVRVTVEDGQGGEASMSFQWTVTMPPNNPPDLTSPGEQENFIGDTVSLQLVASDLDDDPLTFSAEGLPQGLTVDEETGLISGTTTAVTSTTVTIAVKDGQGGEDSVSFTWIVTEVPNNEPEVDNPGDQLNEVGEEISLFISASDADDDPLLYGAVGLPTGLSVDDKTGEISGELTAVGTFDVVISADDGLDSGKANFTWVVEEPAEPMIGDHEAFLPILMQNHKVDEPNNNCDQSYPIRLGVNYTFFHEDAADWYAFTLSSLQTVQVRLTNFNAPGQIITYSGTCNSLVLLKNNGNFSSTKIINLPNLTPGTYYIRVITDGNFNETTPYNLIVD